MLRGDDWRAGGQRPPELRPRCLLAVGHGENLQVAAAQRNGPVMGAQALVPPAPAALSPCSASSRAAAASRSVAATMTWSSAPQCGAYARHDPKWRLHRPDEPSRPCPGYPLPRDSERLVGQLGDARPGRRTSVREAAWITPAHAWRNGSAASRARDSCASSLASVRGRWRRRALSCRSGNDAGQRRPKDHASLGKA